MSALHAYADESVRSGRYVRCVVVVESNRAGGLRRRVRKSLLPGQRKLHFKKESPRRRKELLSAFGDLDIAVTAYVCRMREGRSEAGARARCLERAVRELQERGGDLHLVVESRDGLDEDDAIVIRRARALQPALSFEHVPPDRDPLLWLADAFAWPVGAGGDWLRRVDQLVAVVDVG